MSEKLEENDHQKNPVVKLEEINVYKLLSTKGLTIPEYQRPYMWDKKNVYELFLDLSTVIEKTKIDSMFVYRLGSVILDKKKNSYEIVDGQQRITTLYLIIKCLFLFLKNINKVSESFRHGLISKASNFIGAQFNVCEINKKYLSENYKYIKNKISNESDNYIKTLYKLFKKNVKVMQFVVDGENSESVAFQLFDSQNSRGKDLYPHDLLKAHHLRELKLESKNYAESFVEEEISPDSCYAERWDNLSSDSILSFSELFNGYLFRLKRWLNNESANLVFTKDYIDDFKGIPRNSPYRFAKREFKASPYYQIGTPCCAGSDFFEMIFYYHSILKGIINSFESNSIKQSNDESDCTGTKENKETVQSLVNIYKNYSTFSYTKNLFYATLLLYYDRFNQLDKKAIETIFAWSVYPRVDSDSLHFSYIDSYVLANDSLIKIINRNLEHTKIADNYFKYKELIKKIGKKKNKNFDNVKEIRSAIFTLITKEKLNNV